MQTTTAKTLASSFQSHLPQIKSKVCVCVAFLSSFLLFPHPTPHVSQSLMSCSWKLQWQKIKQEQKMAAHKSHSKHENETVPHYHAKSERSHSKRPKRPMLRFSPARKCLYYFNTVTNSVLLKVCNSSDKFWLLVQEEFAKKMQWPVTHFLWLLTLK